ncbi:MAG: hypothetical protein ACKESB_00385 [Candidatus Hodgkinia cicadicola]
MYQLGENVELQLSSTLHKSSSLWAEVFWAYHLSKLSVLYQLIKLAERTTC